MQAQVGRGPPRGRGRRSSTEHSTFSVNTECFLKQVSRGRVSAGTVFGFCRTPLTILKMLLHFLFLEQLGHYEVHKNHLFKLPRGRSISDLSQGASSPRTHVAGFAPPTAAPNTDSQQEGGAPRQQQTEKFPPQPLAHPLGDLAWGRRPPL